NPGSPHPKVEVVLTMSLSEKARATLAPRAVPRVLRFSEQPDVVPDRQEPTEDPPRMGVAAQPTSPCNARSMRSRPPPPAAPSPPPPPANPRPAPARSGELAAHHPRRAGIVAEVHRPQHRLPEILRVVERPDGGLQGLHHVARALDLGRLSTSETPFSD